MPVYVYKAKDHKKSCKYCMNEFELKQDMNEKPIMVCPKCNNAVIMVFKPFNLAPSKTGFDRKAKDRGFHKLKKVDKGKYEKLY